MKSIVSWSAAVALALIAGWAGPRADAAASKVTGFWIQCLEATAKGPGLCNCTEAKVSTQICHVATVTVTLGGPPVGSFATGQNTSTCMTASIPPGKCVWMEYSFVCCRGFFGWDCSPVGFPCVREGPANC